MKNKKRLHFGVIFSTMDNTNQYDIWNGIVEYAHKNDIHLTAYFGTYQISVDSFASHFETCFDTVRKSSSLDGIIVFSGFIAHILGNEKFEEYIAKIPEHLPVVSVSYVIPGIPSVIVDNIAGMYGAVDHLIRVHNKKRIAFVKGPNGHPEAEDRLEGYKRALAANGIAYDEKYVFPGHFDQDSGKNAVKRLLEEPGFSAEAIAASNDVSAIGVLNELKNYNLLAPADFAVTGFDDDKFSSAFIPSISTARQDFHKFGLIGAGLLFDQINGNPVEKITYIPPVFIERQSCGCVEKEFLNTGPKYKDEQIKTDSLEAYVLHKFIALFSREVPEIQIEKWAAALTYAIKEKSFSEERFLRLLNENLISYNQYSKDILIWNEALNILSAGIEFYSGEVTNEYTIRSTLAYASAFVQNIRFKQREFRDIVLSDRQWMVRRIASNLVLIFDIDSLAEELYKSLPDISIGTVVIGLYQTPVKSGVLNADRTITTLIGFDEDKKFNIKTDSGRPILFSDYSTVEDFDFEKKRRDLFFIPLFFKDEEFGVMLMPFDSDISVYTYETLRINISTAIKGAELIKEIEYQNKKVIEASRAKSNFLSSMSHEMRTPMNAIIGMTTIGKKAKTIEEKEYALNKIEAASSHLLGVINDILDMSKIEADKLNLAPVEFDFMNMIQNVVSIVNFRMEEKEHKFTMDIDENIPDFTIGDDQRIAQVITNLMSNAVKFTPRGGRIYLGASLLEKTGNICELRIEVSDSGIGIAPDKQKKLFQAFEQAESGTSREYGGTGLGLVISKRIIELMEGTIWIESELGKGAKFIFTVKLRCGENFAGEYHGTEQTRDFDIKEIKYEDNRFEGKKILLAEDIEINREIFISLLEDTGIKIDCAENGQEALDMVRADPGGYDIVIMDVQMPKMDGYQATRAIRALPALQGVKLPIVAMTANVFKSDIEECFTAGMDDYLGKPINVEKVFEVLRKYLKALL
ncbi:MAG: ATP-binding protein [Oscillospiraceae bacterium]|nr:ATP-binding protein [Oscillospiraceae bacterium]